MTSAVYQTKRLDEIRPAKRRRVYFQVWDWDEDGRSYVFNLFLVSEEGEGWRTALYDARYRAVLREELRDLLKEAGFSDIGWKKPAESGTTSRSSLPGSSSDTSHRLRPPSGSALAATKRLRQ